MEEMVGFKEGVCEANACKLVPNSSTGQSSVDFPSNDKKDALKCDHFSIRGYVSDIRSKDWELCWPFSPPRENEGLESRLADVLPSLHIPNFRFWDCQKCIQTSDASVNAADVSSVVLETICVGRKGSANTSVNVNGYENCTMTHTSMNENGAITMPDTGRGTTCGITANGAPKEAKLWQNLKNTDVVTRGRRKFCPYESNDENEDEDIHNLLGQRSADQVADPSQIMHFKKKQKFRLLSDILGEESSGVSAKVSSSKLGIHSGDVNTKIDQTKSPYQPHSLALCDQIDFGNSIEEKNKKRKALEDEDQDHLRVRRSKSLAKSDFYHRYEEENEDGPYSNDKRHFSENGKHGKVSQNQISDKESLFEDRANHKSMGKNREVERVEVPTAHCGLQSSQVSEQNYCTSAKQKNTHQTHVEASTLRPKDLPWLCNSEKKKKLNETEAIRNRGNGRDDKMGESEVLDDVSLEIVELLANSRHERRCQEAQNVDQIKSRVSEKTVNVIDSENVSRECGKISNKIRNTSKNNSLAEKQMLQFIDKDYLVSSSSHFNESVGTQFGKDKLGDTFCRWDGDKLVSCKRPISTSYPNHQTISHLNKMQVGANHVSRQSEGVDDLETHRKILLEQPCACTQKKTGNFAKPVAPTGKYTNRYMPATELLELMDAGMCPTIPHPEKSNQIPIQKTDFSKDHSNLGLCHFPSSSINYSVILPDQRHEGSALSKGNKKSQKMVSDDVKIARKKSFSSLEVDCVLKKHSCGNKEMGIKNDPFCSNVMPVKSESLSLEHRLTYDSVATLECKYGNLGIEVCSMNRNPADFTIPAKGNRFMLGARELKMWRMFAFKTEQFRGIGSQRAYP